MKRAAPKDRPPARAPGSQVTLRPGREKSVRGRHPWIFSGAVASIGDKVADGDVAEVVSAEGTFVARGMVNRRSQIAVRLLTFDASEPVDDAFWSSRLARAVGRRGAADATRLVNAESDGLPGLVVDRYGRVCVLQVSTLGMDQRKAALVQHLVRLAEPLTIWERSDGDGRSKDGLEPSTGHLFGEEPPEHVHVQEPTHDGRSVTLLVDVRRGHKTGAYLDQSESRRVVGARAKDAEILNLFSYTGAFSLHAAAGGARHVVNVDSSAEALALSTLTATVNGFGDRIEHLRADAFEVLRRLRAEGRSFDIVIVDPPKLAPSASHVERAARAYKDLSRLAFLLLRPQGLLATFSCSGAISADLFQKIVWSASVEAAREAQILKRLSFPADHPVALAFPEGDYLKGLLCKVG